MTDGFERCSCGFVNLSKNGENGYPKSLWLILIFLLLYINNFGATPIFKDAAIWVFPEIRQPEIIGFPIRNNHDLGWSWDPTEDFRRMFSDTNLLQSLSGGILFGVREWQDLGYTTTIHYHISTTADCSNWSPQCLLCPLSYIIVLYFFLGDEETTPTFSYLRWL